MDTTKKAALYARVSSAEQARPDATSIDQQLERGANYAAAMGWEVVERLSDDGITGSTSLAERPQGRRLLATEAEVVIFWSMDRFTRSASKGLRDIETLEERGTALVFVKEAIDTSTPSGRLFRTMLAAFAEFEREQIRDRNMSGRFGGAEKGRWVAGRLPFGYRLDKDGTIAIEEAEAEIVRRIFSLRLDGLSMPAIAAHLNKHTTMTPRDRIDRRSGQTIPARFSAGSIKSYLSNGAYRGDPIQRSISAAKGAKPETFSYPAPVIVDPVDWAEAQKPLVGRRVPDGAGEKRGRYALSERVFHRHPDRETPATMFGQRRGDRRSYRCSESRTRGHRDRSCPGLGITPNGRPASAIDADWVEGSTLLWVIDTLGTPAQVVRFLEDTERRLTPAVSAAEAREERERLQARRDRWLGLYTDGVISKEELDRNLMALKVEEAAVQRILDDHSIAASSREKVAATLEDLMALKVEDIDHEDPHAWEDPPRGSGEWRHRLRSEAGLAAHREKALSSWAIEEAAHLFDALDITAVLSEGLDYRTPVVTLEVGYEEFDLRLGGRALRFRLM